MEYTDYCNIKVMQDDDGNWWLEYYLDDVRYGVSLDDIHAAQHSVQADGWKTCGVCGVVSTLPCPHHAEQA